MNEDLNNNSGPEAELSTAKYLVENPEHAEYLRRANRRQIDPKEIAEKIKKWSVILLCLIGLGWSLNQLRKSKMGYQTNAVQITRTFKAMFSSLNQEKRVWDTIEGRR